MGERPEITIQPQSFRLTSPQVPRNPVPEAVRRLGKETQATVQDVAGLIIRQKQLTDDHKAILEFGKGLNNIEEHLQTVEDPQEKIDFFNTELQSLLGNIKEDHKISEQANYELTRQAEAKSNHISLEIQKQQHAQNIKDFHATVTDLALQAAQAKTHDDRQNYERLGVNYIDSTSFIGSPEKELIKQKFLHSVAKSYIDELVRTSPKHVLDLTINSPEATRLTDKEITSAQNAAYSNLYRQDKVDRAEFNHARWQAEEAILLDPEKANNPDYSRLARDSIIRAATGHARQNPDLQKELSGKLNEIEDIEELDSTYHNMPFGSLSPTDTKVLKNVYEDRKKQLKDPQIVHVIDLHHKLRQYRLDHLGLNLTDPLKRAKSADIVSEFYERAKRAQKLEEIDKYYDAAQDKLDKLVPESHKKQDPHKSLTEDSLDRIGE